MNIALVLAGGTGSRLGEEIPKQYIEVGGRPLISYCLHTLEQHREIDQIQIVAGEKWHGLISKETGHKFHGFSKPGAARQLSILNGLEDILCYGKKDDLVLIHDGARPLVSPKQISACLEAVKGHDGAIPVLPMKDTVYISENGKSITSLLDRSHVFAGQAPECFLLKRYYDANTRLLPDRILKINGSTEPAVMAGLKIALVEGDESNFKITTKEDMDRFKQMMERGKAGLYV